MILVALALWALGAAISVTWRTARAATTLAWLVSAVASVLTAVIGFRALGGHTTTASLGSLGLLGEASLRIDPLSGMFLAVSFACAVPLLLAGSTSSSAAAPRPRLPAVTAAMLASLVLIMGTRNLFLLLFGWESLTLTFYLLAGYDRDRSERAHASVRAALFGKTSGAALLLGALLLAAQAHTMSLDALGAVPAGGLRSTGYALLLVGFGIKVGLVPMQLWLPPTYGAAPGPARGLMAGVAVNAGFYGLWRTLEVLGRPPLGLVVAVLAVGGVTAILGIAHAAVSHTLTGLIAWSSVENAGLITTGFGVALEGAWSGNQRLVAAGLVAATAQVCAHSLGKSLLFCATAAVEHDARTVDLDLLHGVGHGLRYAGAGLAVGSITLAGLPLTAGLVSEWLTLESLMQQFRLDSLTLQLAATIAGALVALTIGIAGLTFVRLVAFTAYGASNGTTVRPVADRRPGHRVGIVLLSTACIGLSVVAPWEVQLIARGLGPLVGDLGRQASTNAWVIQPVFGGFSALSPSWLFIVLPLMALAVVLVTAAMSGRRLSRVRRAPVWSSGSPGVDRGLGYTSFAFANPMRHVLANVLHTSTSVLPAASPKDAPRTATTSSRGPTLVYEVDVVDVVERYLYGPVRSATLQLSRLTRRLQSGRLDAYMAYMLVALLAVLVVATVT